MTRTDWIGLLAFATLFFGVWVLGEVFIGNMASQYDMMYTKTTRQ